MIWYASTRCLPRRTSSRMCAVSAKSGTGRKVCISCGSPQQVVHEAPPPCLTWLDRAHHRVAGLGEVCGRVLADRRVAAADVAALEAQPQMHPARAVAQALRAA